jgi:flagellar motor switch protein FliN/FliY
MSGNMQPKLVEQLETALGLALASMTGADYKVVVEERSSELAPLDEPIIWQQSFSIIERPSLWIAAGKSLWEAIGKATLEAAGIDSVTEEDCRSTWQEIINQTTAGIANSITADQGREVNASKGEQVEAEPPDLNWVSFSVVDSTNAAWSFKAAWIRELAALGDPPRQENRSPAARDNAVSKTFDLLLEVALPVSVSFGRTSLQIKEVLKLNTGSIVELNRFITDPVEVIVNDCVIARGEVVVVDGNYGVRINQLASREDRMRSGMAEAAHKGSARL